MSQEEREHRRGRRRTWSAVAALVVAVAAWVVPMWFADTPVGVSSASGQVPICDLLPDFCVTPTPSASPSPTQTPTQSPTPSPTVSATPSATASASPSATASPTTTATATATGSPTSSPTPPNGPTLGLSVPKGQKAGEVRREGLRVKASCDVQCSVLVTASRKGKKLGTGRRALVRKGTVRVRFNGRGRRALRKRTLRVDVLGKAVDSRGRLSAAVARTATIRRRP